jgi:hypothetical protein
VKIDIRDNFPDVARQLQALGKQAPGAAREALNRTAEVAEGEVVKDMQRVFDRPVPFTLRSLRVFYANTRNLQVSLWFRQRSREDDKLWAVPQILGGQRQAKPMELRLQQAGLLPAGWKVVPGGAAPLDAYGNMSRGEISRILNVLGTFREAGYNKANAKTKDRLRKGNAKKGAYGFAYWVNPVNGPGRRPHLQPGIYRRVYTGFGQSLKPMLIFVKRATYRRRLPFFETVQRVMQEHFPAQFDKAMQSLVQTGSASALRRGRVA